MSALARLLQILLMTLWAAGVRAEESSERRKEALDLLQQGDRARDHGRWAEAQAAYEKALLLLRQETDRGGEGAVLYAQGVMAERQGRLDQAAEHYRASLAACAEGRWGEGWGNAIHALGALARQRHNLKEAGRWYRRLLFHMRWQENAEGEVDALVLLATVAYQGGDVREGRRLTEEVLALCQGRATPSEQAPCLAQVGGLLYDHALDAAAALALFEEARARAASNPALLADRTEALLGVGRITQFLDEVESALRVRQGPTQRAALLVLAWSAALLSGRDPAPWAARARAACAAVPLAVGATLHWSFRGTRSAVSRMRSIRAAERERVLRVLDHLGRPAQPGWIQVLERLMAGR